MIRVREAIDGLTGFLWGRHNLGTDPSPPNNGHILSARRGTPFAPHSVSLNLRCVVRSLRLCESDRVAAGHGRLSSVTDTIARAASHHPSGVREQIPPGFSAKGTAHRHGESSAWTKTTHIENGLRGALSLGAEHRFSVKRKPCHSITATAVLSGGAEGNGAFSGQRSLIWGEVVAGICTEGGAGPPKLKEPLKLLSTETLTASGVSMKASLGLESAAPTHQTQR